MASTSKEYNFQQQQEMSSLDMDISLDESIIEAVRDKPEIWNMMHKDYRNRMIRPRLWEDVLKDLNMEKNAENLIKIRKKWENIRSAYLRSKKVLPSGSGASNLKLYKYARMLSFIDDSTQARKTIELSNFESDNSNSNSCFRAPDSKNKRLLKQDLASEKQEIKKRFVESIENLTKVHSIPSAAPPTPQKDSFLDMLGTEMSQLPTAVQRRLKLKIHQMLIEEFEKI